MKAKIFLQVLCLAVMTWGLPGLGQAKDKPPPQYQAATLKEIRETKEPQTEYKNLYHIKVELGDEIIVGRWSPTFSFGKPPAWTVGQPVQIRIQKNHMWLQKPNGKELKTKIEERSQAEPN
ncbi:MAG: hypothetical protein R3257_05425 [bacterium]|nr:hypothetical protein [bacterium]